jgi:hypothetical protein
MSFNFHMYRGVGSLPPLTEWEENMATPIGVRADVCDALSKLLPSVEWKEYKNGHTFGSAVDARYDVGYALSTFELEGAVVLISTDNRASSCTLAKIMDHFSLNYCCTDFGDFRDPHTSDDDWNPISKPAWPGGQTVRDLGA